MRITPILLALFLAGCTQPTQFHGEPLVPGGRGGCEQVCATHGMVLAGMVSMGQGYTDGCICLVPNQAPSANTAAVAAAAPAVTGVVLQMRAAEEEQRRRQQQTAP